MDMYLPTTRQRSKTMDIDHMDPLVHRTDTIVEQPLEEQSCVEECCLEGVLTKPRSKTITDPPTTTTTTSIESEKIFEFYILNSVLFSRTSLL